MSNTAKINDWLQVIAMFGVIASLVFVGLQMKQAQDIAYASTYQARTAAVIEHDMGAINSSEFLSGMAKIYVAEIESLTAQEAIALEWWFGSWITLMENSHLQHQRGFLPDEHWQKNFNQMVCWLEMPFFLKFIIGSYFRASFQLVIDDAISQSTSNPTGCWEVDRYLIAE